MDKLKTRVGDGLQMAFALIVLLFLALLAIGVLQGLTSSGGT